MATYQKIDNVNGPVYGSPPIPNWETASGISSRGISRGSLGYMNPNRNNDPINNSSYVCNDLPECDGFFYIGNRDQNYVNSNDGTNIHIYFYKYTGDSPNSCIIPSEFYSDSTSNDPLTGFYTKQIYHQNCRIERPEPSVSEQTTPVDCVLSPWSQWSSCSETCGGGTQSRTRTILTPAENGGTACGDLSESQDCNTDPCPVDCEMSDWSQWSSCSETCGTGTQSRTRTILTEPTNGGTACGDLSESQDCNTQPCPLNTDCVGTWSACTSACETASQRTFTETQAQSGTGAACPQAVDCNPGDGGCPPESNSNSSVDCVLSPWSEWSSCSETCGTGTQSRTRTILTPAENGGTACGDLSESQDCNTDPCPVDCVLDDFGDWLPCSETCGGGTQSRTQIILTAAQNGGSCNPNTETRSCNTQPCPVNCVLGDFGNWSKCSSFLSGTKTRNKRIITAPQNGGNPCPNRTQTKSCGLLSIFSDFFS